MASQDERIHRLELALHSAKERIRELEATTKATVQETLAETIFVGRLREALQVGRVREEDREYWRELFLEDADAFDIAINHDWQALDPQAAELLKPSQNLPNHRLGREKR
jgi:hypothetical protein